jgi:ABC-type molybdate transport system substrate-binding protein
MLLRLTARIAAIAILPLVFQAAAPDPAFADDPVVFAAASLKNALDDAVVLYKERTGEAATLN